MVEPAPQPRLGDLFDSLSNLAQYLIGDRVPDIGDSVIHNPTARTFEINLPNNTEPALVEDLIDGLTEAFAIGAPVTGLIDRRNEGDFLVLSIPVANINHQALVLAEKELKPGESTDLATQGIKGLRGVTAEHLPLLANLKAGMYMAKVTDGTWRITTEDGTSTPKIPGEAKLVMNFPNTIPTNLRERIMKVFINELNQAAGADLSGGGNERSVVFQIANPWALNAAQDSIGLRAYVLTATAIDPERFPEHQAGLERLFTIYGQQFNAAVDKAIADAGPNLKDEQKLKSDRVRQFNNDLLRDILTGGTPGGGKGGR